METGFDFNFLLLSAALNGLMMVLKKFKPLSENKAFGVVKPLVPPVLGMIAGAFVFTELVMVNAILAGLLAGTLSTTSYEAFKATRKKME